MSCQAILLHVLTAAVYLTLQNRSHSIETYVANYLLPAFSNQRRVFVYPSCGGMYIVSNTLLSTKIGAPIYLYKCKRLFIYIITQPLAINYSTIYNIVCRYKCNYIIKCLDGTISAQICTFRSKCFSLAALAVLFTLTHIHFSALP